MKNDIKPSKHRVDSYIFLDVDGVLNSSEDPGSKRKKLIGIGKSEMKNLADLAAWTDSKVVLVSSWCQMKGSRRWRSLMRKFRHRRIQVAGDIYEGRSAPDPNRRGRLVKEWLADHPSPNGDPAFVILDDEKFDYIDEGLALNLVQPDYNCGGLTREMGALALSILDYQKDRWLFRAFGIN